MYYVTQFEMAFGVDVVLKRKGILFDNAIELLSCSAWSDISNLSVYYTFSPWFIFILAYSEFSCMFLFKQQWSSRCSMPLRSAIGNNPDLQAAHSHLVWAVWAQLDLTWYRLF